MPLTKGTENLRRVGAIIERRNVDKSKQQKYKHRNNVTSLNFRGSRTRRKTDPEFSGDNKGVRWMPKARNAYEGRSSLRKAAVR